eukprot:TRINITY_DN12265_c0_g3_i10.p1 TRINITY_DN12265_c0_g3~~TRINITY_DN12265_c0_g3_i10.p1  ORF type:complete len:530 (+),score=74.32 TRINITY_DN12265_c0_g3_i10:1825-3414(+)
MIIMSHWSLTVCSLLVVNSLCLCTAAQAAVDINWKQINTTVTTKPSVLVAADPEWIASGRLSPTAISAIRNLSQEGLDYVRLLNFNIFPGISCAQLEPNVWNFTMMDQVLASFMNATEGTQRIIDIETSPLFMWSDASSDNAACANASSINALVSPTTRCPFYGNVSKPRDESWKEIARYHSRIHSWYTDGGFEDDNGIKHTSSWSYSFDYWEVLNEVDLPREHDMTPESYTAFYDTAASMLLAKSKGKLSSKLIGPSLAGAANPAKSAEWFGYFLNRSNHYPRDVPMDAISMHAYSMCNNNTPIGMEAVFQNTYHTLNGLRTAWTLRNNLNPDVEIHLTESGILCNSPRNCDSNDYSCWYRSFDVLYWAASAGQWLMQYLLTAQAINPTSIAHSQILGYPYRYDGLSGEWPCGSMIDWDCNQPNLKYWVTLLVAKHLKPPLNLVDTHNDQPEEVYVQGITTVQARAVVIINKRSTSRTVSLARPLRNVTMLTIDGTDTAVSPPTEEMYDSIVNVALSPFATVLLLMEN